MKENATAVAKKSSRFTLSVAIHRRGSGFPARSLLFGFAGIILAGTLLLMLPLAARTGQITSPVDAVFTATSAVCVTGLAVVDTGTYWTFFGQFVVLLLMQIGGFGFMTGATVLISVFGRRIGLTQRLLVSESLSMDSPGGMVKLVRHMAIFTVIVEGGGALIFFLCFLPGNAPGLALWQGVFHAVSSFNNCGFDIFGNFRSLTGFQQNAPVLLLTAALFILGGLGFSVVIDLYRVRRWDRLSLNSKIVLTVSTALLTGGTVVFLLVEYLNPGTLQPMSFPEKILSAFFQSATTRSAGFNSLDLNSLFEFSLFFSIWLMFIGAGSGSTAGGIKVNTVGLLFATVVSTIQGKQHAGAFGRTFNKEQIYRALTITFIFMVLVLIAVFLLSFTEKIDLLALFFETVSAAGNVGLDPGVAPGLSLPGRLLITVLMFAGRLGPLTLVMSLRQRPRSELLLYPEENISIG